MARTANPKNVKLSNISIPGTDKFYPSEFVDIMKMSGQDNEEIWPALFRAMNMATEVRSKKAADKVQLRKDRLAAKISNVKEILAELGLTLPEGVEIKSLEVKPRGPMVVVLDEDGKATDEKEQDITHYDVDLRFGKKGTSRLFRGSVSTGGKKEPKEESVVDAEIKELKEELIRGLLKLMA